MGCSQGQITARDRDGDEVRGPGNRVRVFPYMDQVRWWQARLSHLDPDAGEYLMEGQQQYALLAYCSICNRSTVAWDRRCSLDITCEVEWTDERGLPMYQSIHKKLKKEVQAYARRRKPAWARMCAEMALHRATTRAELAAEETEWERHRSCREAEEAERLNQWRSAPPHLPLCWDSDSY